MIENKRPDDVIAFEDEDFLILHAKDRFNGIRVQLYAKIPTRRLDSDGVIKHMGKTPQLLEEVEVSFLVSKQLKRPAPTNSPAPDRNQLLDPTQFRSLVLGAEAQLKTKIDSHYRRMDHMADGLLNDLRGKYKDLNGEHRES